MYCDITWIFFISAVSVFIFIPNNDMYCTVQPVDPMDIGGRTGPRSLIEVRRTIDTDDNTRNERDQTTQHRAGRLYETVRAERLHRLAATSLSDLAAMWCGSHVLCPYWQPDTEAWLQLGKYLLHQLYGWKLNVSYSFDLENLTCLSRRSKHRKLVEGGKRATGRHSSLPDYFAWSVFPRHPPKERSWVCIKFIRLEDASIEELARHLLRVTADYLVPAGSVIMISSLSHLVRLGYELTLKNWILNSFFVLGNPLMYIS